MSKLTATGSKWATTKPLYPADLGNNMDLYDRKPNFKDQYWKQLAIVAEKYNYNRSTINQAHEKQALIYCAMTSGRDAMVEIIKNPRKALEYSQILDSDAERPFLTYQRAADVLDSHQVGQLIKSNSDRNLVTSSYAAAQNPDLFIVGPAHREAFLRNLSDVPSLTRGATFPDEVFETHLWVPACLLEFTHGIYHSDHAWSRNACPEKATGLAIQYGSSIPLAARADLQFDVIDIHGHPISVVDQAWEDMRALVDICQQHVTVDGEDFGFRNEALATLVVSRLMHDDMWLRGDDMLLQYAAHQTVRDHYDSSAEMQKMADLKDMALPYLKAKTAQWGNLQKILDADYEGGMRQYWDNHVATAPDLSAEELQNIETKFLSYLPRGGYECADLNAFVKTRFDDNAPRQATGVYNQMSHKAQQKGLLDDPLDEQWKSKIFDDGLFCKLGGENGGNPAHLNFDQAALMLTLPAMLSGGIAPTGQEQVYLYLDDPNGGACADEFTKNLQNIDASELSGLFDALSAGTQTFDEQVSKENSNSFGKMILRLIKDPQFADWRQRLNIGNIVPVSTIQGLLGAYSSGYREAIDTHLYEGISAQGSATVSSEAKEALVRYFVKLGAHGVIAPKGTSFADKNNRYLTEGMLVALGLQPRLYSGGKYDFKFFQDNNYDQAPAQQIDPQQLDFLDVFIKMGLDAKDALQQPQPTKRRDLYVSTARMIKLYDMMTRDADSIIDINQVDAGLVDTLVHGNRERTYTMSGPLTGHAHEMRDESYIRSYLDDPIFQDFNADKLDISAYQQDPIKKAELAHMLYIWLREMPVPHPQDAQQDLAKGMLLARGVHCLDIADLKDLDPDYKAARDQWNSMTDHDRQAVFQGDVVHLDRSAVSFRHGNTL